ncbi:CTLH/CRA C-terminal to lish motif domain-containing protein [Russula earlei]|uniref:CTLH/CRA C-terminal to lish motif domain-containing protein n=1 Tax=Russula earlei TaxID=71964 RepID=A0ACC0UD62_9AGAM|nr:CTLH/CRA C-terminal to lish motif domain-containing protein [Russula earlei]
MASNRVNLDGLLIFEQPFARVPYENYRKVFRAAQKNIERELGAIQAASNDLGRNAQNVCKDTQEAIKSLEGMIGRVESLKRKVTDLQATAGSPTLGVMRERCRHLAIIEQVQSSQDSEHIRWVDTRLDRWIVDWVLRHGREKTARHIANEKGIEELVDIDLFVDIRRIEDALRGHSCTEALAWCSENKNALRKLKSTLEFDLRLQEYIELARERRTIDAIAYARKHLIPWQETHLMQIQQASALLAFSRTTTCNPYKRLYDSVRWSNLIQSFRLAIFSLNTLPSEPLLHLALYGGLSSLKLPTCYDHDVKNRDCPVCDPWLGKLAEEVPFSHHVNSTIVCRLSGKIMDEDNAPMAFPNGYVYSREALEDMSAQNDGKVKCPRTQEECDFSNLKKVFIS